MMKMKNKILAMLLCAVLVMEFLPVRTDALRSSSESGAMERENAETMEASQETEPADAVATGTLGSGGELTWIYSGLTGQMTVVGQVSRTEPVYIASYEASGKMISSSAIFSSGEIVTAGKVSEIKLFWLDANGVPKCEHAVICGLDYAYFTVTFDTNTADPEDQPVSQQVKAGSCAVEPEVPSRTIHEFGGWYVDSECTKAYDFSSPVYEDVTLYAKWTITNYSKEPEEGHIQTGTVALADGEYDGMYVDNQLIVAVEEGASREDLEALIASCGGAVVGQIPAIGYFQIELESQKTAEELALLSSELLQNDLIEDVYLNLVNEYEPSSDYSPNDGPSWKTSDWDQDAPQGSNWNLEAIRVPSAWQLLIDKYGSVQEIPVVDVGIVDYYFDLDHEDLIYQNFYYKNKWINVLRNNNDILHVSQLAERAATEGEYDCLSHGTHVAGILAATPNNGKGISGIALNSRLSVIATGGEAASNNMFSTQTILSCLIESAENKKAVINYSLALKAPNQLAANWQAGKIEKELEKYLDLGYDFVISACAGNMDGSENSYDAIMTSEFTAVRNERVKSRILVVGAANQKYQFSDYYAYGSRIDVAAPGVNIYSAVPASQSYSGGKLYRVNSGTSMAAPHVAGVAALVWAADPALTGDQVKEIIVRTANIPLSGNDSVGFHHDMVNAEYAVAEALDLDVNGEETVLEGSCGENLRWTLNLRTGELLVTGCGEMVDYGTEPVPWYDYKDLIQSVVIGDGVSSVSTGAFLDCGNLSNLRLGSDVREIGESSFSGCEKLYSVTFPEAVIEIGPAAFPACKTVYFSGDAPEVRMCGEDEGSFGSQVTVYYRKSAAGWQLDEDGRWMGYRTIASDEAAEGSLFAGGAGTEENPYQITAVEQLDAMRTDLNAHYVLISDLDLSGFGSWTPIGTLDAPFAGTLDGQGHSITGLQLDNVSVSNWLASHEEEKTEVCLGLFGYVDHIECRNLIFRDVDVQFSLEDLAVNFGVVLGKSSEKTAPCVFENCTVSGEILVANLRHIVHELGGFAGHMHGGVFSGCVNNATIIYYGSGPRVGGFVGYSYNVGFTDCVNNSEIIAQNYATTSGTDAGGIAGFASDCSFLRCGNSGNISAIKGSGETNLYAGGIVGLANGCDMIECVNFGNILAKRAEESSSSFYACAGGIFGRNCFVAEVSNCVNFASEILAIGYTEKTTRYGYAGRIGGVATKVDMSENYSASYTLVNGELPKDDVGADQINGANLP